MKNLCIRKEKKYASVFCIAGSILIVLLTPLHGIQDAPPRPLFIQVHPTNPVFNISSHELTSLLEGRVLNFTQIGGANEPIRFFADPCIVERLKKSYPALKPEAHTFDDAKVMSNRRFFGISDLRGLRPFLKTVYIDRTLPWGSIQGDRSLARPGTYPFFMDGAEAWEPGLHLSVVQTGVTAMTRMFIHAVEKSGDLLYPIRYTKKITEQADLAMTSNEVSFLEPCHFPLKNNLVFCSPNRYFTILLKSGFDVIELTGNHNNDFGFRHDSETIEMMEHAGIVYFGGGKNKKDAESVRYITARGTTIAFVGFNECGPEAAWATDTHPGAARLSRELFVRSVSEAAKKAEVVFVTVQWCNENNPVPEKKQIDYFHMAADLGATIIVSSSAHRPMGLEFYRGRFISYGLGNFLFDQTQSEDFRSGLIARHHLYKGRHIATELIPYMIYDCAQPRIVSGSRERKLMQEVFKYSIGPVFR